MLVGLTPGLEEDLEGEPFVGRWKRLLDGILTSAGIEPASVYKTYLVKCMPKKKQRVASAHILACKTWLYKEILSIGPKVVVPFGHLPAKTLLLGASDFRLEDYLGKPFSVPAMSSVVAPWHSLDKVLQGGVALRKETVSFFSNVRKFLL